MGRRRTKKLPPGISARRRADGRESYRIDFVDQHGKRRFETAGTDLREAKRLKAQREREVDAGTYEPRGGASAAMTLDELAERWFRQRARQGKRSVDDERTRYEKHVAPVLGARRVGDIRPRDVADLVEALRRGPLAAKSIRNVHGVLHGMLEQARFDELLVANPASLPRGVLPRVAKKKKPRFTREELWQLVTDPAIAEHRRVFYALQALGGLRLGEASGRRWRDLDPDTPGLGALSVHSQYEDQPLKTADAGEDTRERVVPVHPALAELLERWRREGFAALYGRHPRPGDWLCPDPRTGAPRTQNQAIKALYRDLARVGIPRRVGADKRGRACHAFRHSFISLSRSDGARKDVLEVVTHNSKGDVVDGYTSFEWPAMCEAVGALRFELARAEVVALPQQRAAGAEGAENDDAGPSEEAGDESSWVVSGSVPCATERATGGSEPGFPMEAAGVEPPARSASSCHLGHLGGPGGAGRAPQKARESSPIKHAVPHGTAERLVRAAELLRELGHEDLAAAVDEALAQAAEE